MKGRAFSRIKVVKGPTVGIVHRLGRLDLGVGTIMHVHNMSHYPIARFGTAAQKQQFLPPAARGEKIYAANCAVCHRPDGKGAGPIKPLDGSPVVQDADKARQIAVLLNGQNNGAMPSWKQLSDTELAAVASYVRNAWGKQPQGEADVRPVDVLQSKTQRVH